MLSDVKLVVLVFSTTRKAPSLGIPTLCIQPIVSISQFSFTVPTSLLILRYPCHARSTVLFTPTRAVQSTISYFHANIVLISLHVS